MSDAYYRVQLAPGIEIGPRLEVVFDPERHPDGDTVYFYGLRTRIALRALTGRTCGGYAARPAAPIPGL